MEVIMTDQDIFHKDTEYIAHTYQRFPVAVRCANPGSLILTAKKNCGSCARKYYIG